MKIDVKVKNLGKIREAEFHILPMTVITGPNGTGKSFFTKSLYSILNVINKNVYHESISQSIRKIQGSLRLLASCTTIDRDEIEVSTMMIAYQEQSLRKELDDLKNELEEVRSYKIDDYCIFATSKKETVNAIRTHYNSYLNVFKRNMSYLKIPSLKEKGSYVGFDKSIAEAEDVNTYFDNLIAQLESPISYYSSFFETQFENELKDNFQTPILSELISFGEKKIEIEIDEILKIELNNIKIISKLHSDFIDEVSDLSSVVFFESPAYWKVREALKSAKNNQNRPNLPRTKDDDILTGVPKYFYDLDNVLNIRTKTEGVFKSATDLLKNTLGGEFVFKDDNFTFIDNDRREISKHLVSFGMTNLGMIQALLKYNVITEGSFIFIDEPETNLHPDWQVKLVEVLLMLANGGVNIVITTHSSDLVKALEVKIKKLQIESMEDFLSVHFVDVDGKLFEFESEDKLQQLIEARNLLSLAYQELYFSDL